MELQLHDRVKMKKPHPCGCAIFEVTRLGVDYKLKCTGCGREVLLPRIKAEKLIRGVVHAHYPSVPSWHAVLNC